MLQERALVMDITNKYATVMLPGGRFRRIRRRGRHLVVGQEIWLGKEQFGTLSAAALAVAVSFAAILLAFQGVAPASVQAIGVVSVDINPSINLLVTSQRTVAKAAGLDAAGRHILSQYQPVGASVANAVVTITGIAVHDGYSGSGRSVVLIGGVFKHGVPLWFASVVGQERHAVNLHHWPLSVAAVAVSNGQWMRMINKRAISAGRYLLWRSYHNGHGYVSSKLALVPLGRLLSHSAAGRPNRPMMETPLANHQSSSSQKKNVNNRSKALHPQLGRQLSHLPKGR
ncbi:MAG: hypothetical protein C7B46_13460 [Sulfobacillus benefaciens]|uniref:RsgI N-terminal anti-sigma domain-containing protein n=1 Tax=Sulfobacillus benefaciens TaxID=453960 RepID=A0A2T2XDV9_9FIRM|nr:MAG: hypothetical protein C7B46_13460 [Sulfobacillus benefaciens]